MGKLMSSMGHFALIVSLHSIQRFFSVVLRRSVGTVGIFSASRVFGLLVLYAAISILYCKKGLRFSRPQPGVSNQTLLGRE
jgi:hypothetical protein